MDIRKAIQHALDGQAILFAGSGFSFGAKNLNGHFVKLGYELRDFIATKCGYSATTASLETVSTFFVRRNSPQELISLLRDEYSIRAIQKHHKQIMTAPWKRVYTTNYDHVIEKSAAHNRTPYNSITLSSDFAANSKSNICIHINGSIEKLDLNTINKEFKLIDKSYSCEVLNGNPWFEFMKSDFESASAIIVVGYSLQFDIDIKRLFALPSIRNKVSFIVGPTDEMDLELLRDYGDVETFGVQTLGDIIEDEKSRFVKSFSSIYSSFEHQHLAPFIRENVTFNDIFNTYFLGKYSDKIMDKDATGSYKYVIHRHDLSFILNNLHNKRVFLITSDLGNGKTLLCNQLRNELRTKDVHVFQFKHWTNTTNDEIENISCIRGKKCVVIIDNYQSHFDILYKFYQYNSSNIVYILTARTSINLLSFRRLCNTLHVNEMDIQLVRINNLNNQEIGSLAYLFKNNSLLSTKFDSSSVSDIEQYITAQCGGKFSNILLAIFESSDIKRRLNELFSQINSSTQINSKIKDISIFILIQALQNIELSLYEVLDLFEADYVEFTARENEFMSEVFDIENESINVKSSIIARSLLLSVIDFRSLINVYIAAYLSADLKFATNPAYEELLKNLMSHSNFIPYLEKENSAVEIERYYNSIRNATFSQNNPFFWEQFASSYLDMHNYPLCKQCLENAFLEASAKSGFIPFQIETIYSRYLVDQLLFDASNSKIDMDKVVFVLTESHSRLIKYYTNPDNNVYYVFKVAAKYSDLFDRFKDDFDKRHASIFIEKSGDMLHRMNVYVRDFSDSPYKLTIQTWINRLTICINECKKKA